MRFTLVIYSNEMYFLYILIMTDLFLQNVNIFDNVDVCSVFKDYKGKITTENAMAKA